MPLPHLMSALPVAAFLRGIPSNTRRARSVAPATTGVPRWCCPHRPAHVSARGQGKGERLGTGGDREGLAEGGRGAPWSAVVIDDDSTRRHFLFFF